MFCASRPASTNKSSSGTNTSARIEPVVSAAAMRSCRPHFRRNQRCSGPNIRTSSSARNSGSKKPAITCRNRPPMITRMTTSTTNDTILATAVPPELYGAAMESIKVVEENACRKTKIWPRRHCGIAGWSCRRRLLSPIVAGEACNVGDGSRLLQPRSEKCLRRRSFPGPRVSRPSPIRQTTNRPSPNCPAESRPDWRRRNSARRRPRRQRSGPSG